MSWIDYKRLLADRNTDPEVWAVAAKANPTDHSKPGPHVEVRAFLRLEYRGGSRYLPGGR